MCGICGVLTYRPVEPPERGVVETMCAAMHHRGPDGRGFLERPTVHLGHVRLSIIDVAGGQQPMSNEDGTIHVVFNGEIYNYLDIRAGLEARGHVLRTHCDTEVLVHLYEDFGRDLVDHLVGEFAFAIWDDRDRSLLLVRDRLGVKPVFYADLGGEFLFASELTALMSPGRIPRRINTDVIDTYLLTKTIPAPHTIYRDVHKLLPGQRIEIRAGRVTASQYWDVKFEPDEGRSEEDFAAELRDLIDDSVRRQLMSEVPLGAFLSGGVDSSTVVTSMARHSQSAVKTFSIGVREASYDESPFYRLVSQQLGLEHHEFVFQPDLIQIIPTIAYHFGEPCAIGSALPLYYLCQLARRYVTVALSGDGADEVFAGYNVYNYMNYVRWLNRGAGWLLGGRWLGRLLGRVQLATTSPLGNSLRRLRKIHRLLSLPPSYRMCLLSNLSDFGPVLLADGTPRVAPPEYVAAFDRVAPTSDWLTPYLYADIKVLLPDEMFTKLDRMTMAHSMEGRVPLVDYRLVELAGRIPSRLKLKHGGVKAIVKKAMRDRLPEAVLKRKKVGFRIPLNEWFRGPLKAMAYDLLTGPSFRQSGLFNADVVAELLHRHTSALDNHGNEILELLMFDVWRRNLHETAYRVDNPQPLAISSAPVS